MIQLVSKRSERNVVRDRYDRDGRKISLRIAHFYISTQRRLFPSAYRRENHINSTLRYGTLCCRVLINDLMSVRAYVPRIRWPKRLISLVTTIGKRNFIPLNKPSGNLANSESRTAIIVVLRFVCVTIST